MHGATIKIILEYVYDAGASARKTFKHEILTGLGMTNNCLLNVRKFKSRALHFCNYIVNICELHNAHLPSMNFT